MRKLVLAGDARLAWAVINMVTIGSDLGYILLLWIFDGLIGSAFLIVLY